MWSWHWVMKFAMGYWMHQPVSNFFLIIAENFTTSFFRWLTMEMAMVFDTMLARNLKYFTGRCLMRLYSFHLEWFLSGIKDRHGVSSSGRKIVNLLFIVSHRTKQTSIQCFQNNWNLLKPGLTRRKKLIIIEKSGDNQ